MRTNKLVKSGRLSKNEATFSEAKKTKFYKRYEGVSKRDLLAEEKNVAHFGG